MAYSSIQFPVALASMLGGLGITNHNVDSAVVANQVDQLTDGDVTPTLQVSWVCFDTGNVHVVELHPANVSDLTPWYILSYLVNGMDGRALYDTWVPVLVAVAL